jgi:chemotaxis protein MotB
MSLKSNSFDPVFFSNKTRMNFIQIRPLLIIALSIVSLQACVTRRQYDNIKAENQRLTSAKVDADRKAEEFKAKFDQADKENKNLKDELVRLKQDTAQTGFMYRKNAQLLKDLFEKYDRLDKSYNQLLANSATERGLLDKEMLKKEKELDRLEKELNVQKADMARKEQEFAKKEAAFIAQEAEKKAELQRRVREIDSLNKNLKAREEVLSKLEGKLADKEQTMSELRNKINSALLGFKQADLTVEIRRGNVYLSLPEKMLFQSGRFNLEKGGEDAIKKVADVLKQNEDIELMIEGHTDDVPMRKGVPGFQDNWDLSALRATSIARIFCNEGISGTRITAAGKSEFYPVDPAKNAEARARNRRIEIILTPKLGELYKLLDK